MVIIKIIIMIITYIVIITITEMNSTEYFMLEYICPRFSKKPVC